MYTSLQLDINQRLSQVLLVTGHVRPLLFHRPPRDAKWRMWIRHGFLVVTLSSGLTSAIPSVCTLFQTAVWRRQVLTRRSTKIINHPSGLVDGLAHNLPNAAVFYLTYMIANGFAAAGSALLQVSLHYVAHSVESEHIYHLICQ